jgi:Flp pilus assembly pilin Flp
LFEGGRLSFLKAAPQPSPDQREGGIMLHDRNGQSVVEYIVVLAIFIALVGGALWEVFSTLKVKFNDVNAEIGS